MKECRMVDVEADAREHTARLIADLGRSDAYPYPVDTIALEETHASLAFLAGDFVYKVKKPVDYGFLDFSTLERRKFFCEEELRLNRRLTRDVYLELVPVVEVGGRLSFHGEGPAREYAVKMRRLDDRQILSYLIENNQVDDSIWTRLSRRLTRFYAEAATGEGIDEWGTVAADWHNIEENIEQSQPYVGTIVAPTQIRLIDEVSRSFLDNERALLEGRLAAGKVREGHGDLHLAHICVEGPEIDDLQIIDCIEFNPRLRCLDIAVDIAFLSMDLDYHGHPAYARRIVDLLTHDLRDPDLPRLVQFFSIYRAHVRAKVACFRTDEIAPELPEFFAVRNEAERYFDLATSYIVESERPTLFLVGGLSGTGKSVISRRLARSIGAGLVSSDTIRLALAGKTPSTRQTVDFGTGIYTEDFTNRTYEEVFTRAEELLVTGRSAVLDATFLNPRWRERARELAEHLGVELLLIECQCPPEVARERLAARARELFEASEADWGIYQEQRHRYGTSFGEEELPMLTLQTDRPSGQILDDVLQHIELRRRL
jgi:aminoglycoside phosphotransferase family enzyme/predicted kinase